MASLLELSHELLHCIFLEINPIDIAALRSSCRQIHSYLDGNRLLFKELYERAYDPPPASTAQEDWDQAIRDAVKLEKLLASSDRCVKDAELEFIAGQIDGLVKNAAVEPVKSRNLGMLRHHFENETNRNSLLNASGLFDKAGSSEQKKAASEGLRQSSAKLHCLYGVPIDGYEGIDALIGLSSDPSMSPANATRSRGDFIPAHKVARGRVYDLSEYTDHSLWGPFKADGSLRVDWEKMESVMVVLGFNLRKFNERSGGRFPMIWDEPFDGATPGSYVPPKEPVDEDGSKDAVEGAKKEEELKPEELRRRELQASLDAQDPYGVSGTWMRIVCFLDYHDLFRYNFGMGDDEDGEPVRGPIGTEEGEIFVAEIVRIILLTPTFLAAIRLIRIKLQVTKVVPPEQEDDDYEDDSLEPDADWSQFTGTRLPIVHFEGSSRSLHASWDPNANSRIRGKSSIHPHIFPHHIIPRITH